jgi:hypothetical protein
MRREVVEKLKLENKRRNPIVRLLLTYRKELKYYQGSALDKFLEYSDEL